MFGPRTILDLLWLEMGPHQRNVMEHSCMVITTVGKQINRKWLLILRFLFHEVQGREVLV